MSSSQLLAPRQKRHPMHAHLALFVKLAIALSHILVKRPPKRSLVLAFQGKHVAQRVHPLPQRLLVQPDRPGELLLPDGRREEGLRGRGLAVKDLRPGVAAEARGSKVGERKDALVEGLLPLAGCRPRCGLVICARFSRFSHVSAIYEDGKAVLKLSVKQFLVGLLQSSMFHIMASVPPGFRTR